MSAPSAGETRGDTRPGQPGLVCFVHIPKTAGTSFRAALSASLDRAQVFPDDDEVKLIKGARLSLASYDALPAARRAGLRLVSAHFYYAELVPRFPHARYVAFLRDPVDRLLSEVMHLKRLVPRFAACSEEQVIASLARGGGRFGLNIMCRYLALIFPFVRQPLAAQDLAASAMRTVQDMAAIGIFEHFDESLALMTATLGWHFGPVKRLNVAPQRLTRARRDQLAALVRPHLGLDQALYDFACADFSRRLRQAGLPAVAAPRRPAGRWLARLSPALRLPLRIRRSS